MKIEIKNRWTGAVILSGDYESTRNCLEENQCADLPDANLQGADLRYANLQCANLPGANLQGADLRYANLQCANLPGANLRYANLQGANLRYANLPGANLRDANLQGADLDYSCFPLCCGGSRFKTDMRLVYQLLAHIASLDSDDPEFAEVRQLIMPYALKSHRATDLRIK